MKLKKIGPNGIWASALWEIDGVPGSRVFKRYNGGWKINLPEYQPRMEFRTRREALEVFRQGMIEELNTAQSTLGKIL